MTKIALTAESTPPPLGPYSPGIRIGNTIQVSGQVAISPETGQFVGGSTYDQTKLALHNISTILRLGGADLDDVVMFRVFLSGVAGFAELNKAFEEILTPPYPARTTLFGGLPPGLLVEIDALAVLEP